MALQLPKSVFIHIPKTGGTWVRSAIFASGIPCNEVFGELKVNPVDANKLLHCKPCDLRSQGFFRFAFVRNPVTFYQSYWAYKMRKGKADYNVFDKDYMRDDFSDFVKTVTTDFPGWVSRLYRKFLGEEYDMVNFIGRQEDLQNDLVQALRLAGETFNEDALRAMPAKNLAAQSDEWKEQCVYTDDLLTRVCEAENDAITHFNYSRDLDNIRSRVATTEACPV